MRDDDRPAPQPLGLRASMLPLLWSDRRAERVGVPHLRRSPPHALRRALDALPDARLPRARDGDLRAETAERPRSATPGLRGAPPRPRSLDRGVLAPRLGPRGMAATPALLHGGARSLAELRRRRRRDVGERRHLAPAARCLR